MTSFYNIYSSIFQIFLSSYDDECLRLCNSHCLSGKACSTKYLIYLPTPHVAPSQSLCSPFNKKSNKIQIFWKWKPFATIHSRPQDVMVIYMWLQKPGWMHNNIGRWWIARCKHKSLGDTYPQKASITLLVLSSAQKQSPQGARHGKQGTQGSFKTWSHWDQFKNGYGQ